MVDKLLKQAESGDSDFLSVGESELRKLAKVCVGNSVYIHKLKQQILSDGKASGDVLFDLETHSQFCTIKIT